MKHRPIHPPISEIVAKATTPITRELDTAIAKLSNTEEKLKKSEQENLNIRSQKQSELQDLQKQNTSLQNTLTEREKILQDLNKKLQEISQESQAKATKQQDLSIENQKLAAKIVELEKDKAELVNSLANKDSLLQKETTKSEILNTRCQAQLEIIEERNRERAELKEYNLELRKDNAQFRTIVSDLQKDLHKVNKLLIKQQEAKQEEELEKALAASQISKIMLGTEEQEQDSLQQFLNPNTLNTEYTDYVVIGGGDTDNKDNTSILGKSSAEPES